MFVLTGKFTMEARQALFCATTEAVAAGEKQTTATRIAANLLRTESARCLLEDLRVDLAALLNELGGDPIGSSAFDAMQHSIRVSETLPPEASPEELADALAHPGNRTFWVSAPGVVVLLEQSREVRAAWEDLETRFRKAADETVSPLHILAALAAADDTLSGALGRHGLTHPNLPPN